ncbi:MAG: DUF4230 domain-containing protein [Fimbriimonas sp.]
MKLTLRTAGIAGVTLVCGMFLLSRVNRADEQQVVPMPLILQKVQALGELHTARYTYQHVFEQTSSRTPEDWTNYVPGAPSLIRASTQNSALVSATAEVEAGVDLSRASVRDEGGVKVLVLPRPHVYRPKVDARVNNARPGVFWRDNNLALKAVNSMEVRVRQAALTQGIVAEAEKNALKSVSALVADLGPSGPRIVFE